MALLSYEYKKIGEGGILMTALILFAVGMAFSIDETVKIIIRGWEQRQTNLPFVWFAAAITANYLSLP